jgi:hypothetical protein
VIEDGESGPRATTGDIEAFAVEHPGSKLLPIFPSLLLLAVFLDEEALLLFVLFVLFEED